MENLIKKSGIRRQLISLKVFDVYFASAFTAVVFFAGGVYFYSLPAGIAAGVAGAVFWPVFLYALSCFYQARLDLQIVNFLNLTESYSMSYDNLVTIFGKVYTHLEDPMKSALRECYKEAYSTGDLSGALEQMERELAHDKFSEIATNLEMCGKYEANYAAVLTAARGIMTDYIKSRKKVKNIVNSAKSDYIVLLLCMAVIFRLIDSFMDESLFEVLISHTAGIVILLYVILVMVYGIFVVFTAGRRTKL